MDKESFYWKAGYEHFGPLLVGFSDWIAGEARREELDQILFLARDGYVPIQAFRLLYPSQNAKTTYFFASRASTLATRVLEEGSLESFLRNAHLRRLSSPALLAQRFDLGSRFLELAAKEAKIDQLVVSIEGCISATAHMPFSQGWHTRNIFQGRKNCRNVCSLRK